MILKDLKNYFKGGKMKTEFILYGLKLNEPDYLESIIHTSFNRNDIDKVKTLATKNGYVKFREATFNGEAPNFADPKLINV